MKKRTQTELVIFTHGREKVKLKGDFDRETLWASQADMARIFGVTPQNITLHVRNIYKDKELTPEATCKEILQVQTEGNREISRQIKHYNLDVIIAVGYRINSVVGTSFRQWATRTLREHITKGYTINPSRITANYCQFMEAVDTLKKLAPAGSPVDTESVLELVRVFADTWFALDAYDKEALVPKKVTKRNVTLTAKLLLDGVAVLKTELMGKGEATENFAQERNRDSVEGIIGNVMQSFGGQALYPTVEEKAAHLLYFIIKNHPFVDGNKRTGAYAFVWYLRRAKLLDTTKLTPATLTALTLLIAESDPQDKEKMTKLVTMLIAGPKRS
jgi:hypothetical protein